MRTLIWSNTFIRAFNRTSKRYQNLQQELENTLRQLAKDPFAPQLENP